MYSSLNFLEIFFSYYVTLPFFSISSLYHASTFEQMINVIIFYADTVDVSAVFLVLHIIQYFRTLQLTWFC